MLVSSCTVEGQSFTEVINTDVELMIHMTGDRATSAWLRRRIYCVNGGTARQPLD